MFNKIGRFFSNCSLKRSYCTYKTIKRPDLAALTEKETTNASTTSVQSAENEAEKAKARPEVDLSKQLRTRILATGPISVADYMREVLTHPQSGYYMQRDVFGREGDFITSPEICQIFTELVAIWFIHEWQKLGSPEFRLIEFGPGRGTLMRDILRVFERLQIIDRHRVSIHLIEISPYLSKLQAECLCSQYTTKSEDGKASPSINEPTNYYQKGETKYGKVPIYWHRLLQDVPDDFSLIVAHEFFDALPVHKFQMADSANKTRHWKEVLIDVNDHSSSVKEKDEEGIEFRYVLSREQTPISSVFQRVPEDQRECLEYSVEMDRIIDLMANRFEAYGGIGLVIDYGHFGEKTDTFRGFRRHALHDPLKSPGTADLTADVDFQRMKYIAERDNRCLCFGPVEQGLFLERMQGRVRLTNLLKNTKSEEQRAHLRSGYDMLTQPEQMGTRFKFFSIFPRVLESYLQKYPVIGFQE